MNISKAAIERVVIFIFCLSVIPICIVFVRSAVWGWPDKVASQLTDGKKAYARSDGHRAFYADKKQESSAPNGEVAAITAYNRAASVVVALALTIGILYVFKRRPFKKRR